MEILVFPIQNSISSHFLTNSFAFIRLQNRKVKNVLYWKTTLWLFSSLSTLSNMNFHSQNEVNVKIDRKYFMHETVQPSGTLEWHIQQKKGVPASPTSENNIPIMMMRFRLRSRNLFRKKIAPMWRKLKILNFNCTLECCGGLFATRRASPKKLNYHTSRIPKEQLAIC